MKVSVDNSRCEAQGQCHAVAPELFDLDEDGYSTIGQDKPVPEGMEQQARDGVDACPMLALALSD